MLKRLGGGKDDRTARLRLELLFHEFSRALVESADKGFHSSSLLLAFHEP